MKIFIPGSYDIPTNGHLHLWREFARIGADVVVAIGHNADKPSGTLLPATRAELCRRILVEARIQNATVVIYEGSLVGAVRDNCADLVVRGIRGPSDLEEGVVFADHLARRGSIPVVFAPAPARLRGVSSSLVRQLLKMPDMNAEMVNLLPPAVHRALRDDALGLRSDFEALWKLQAISGSPSEIFEDLLLRYSTPQRAYHTLEHIRWALRRFGEIAVHERLSSLQVPVGQWAIWFHDAVLSGLPDDERLSSDLARAILSQRGAGAGHHHGFADEVANVILATGHEEPPSSLTARCVVDADLAILASDDVVFNKYEERVREEWRHVDETAFCNGRARILKRFLDRDWIYSTAYAREKWEVKARDNLARSIEQLLRNN